MCRTATVCLYAALAVVLGAAAVNGQVRPEWRHIGNAALDLGLPSVASGPADRVWYSADGTGVYARTAAGQVFETHDFETWTASNAAAPAVAAQTATALPEAAARVRGASRILYAFANNAYRSDDGGTTWNNLTAYHGESILGAPIADLAVSPANPDEIVAVNAAGVWRSVDGGLSWTGMNDALPNLPVHHILELPAGTRGVRIAAGVDRLFEFEWVPGSRKAWRVVVAAGSTLDSLERQRQTAGQALHAQITAVASAGDLAYAGSADGRIWSSNDHGRSWTLSWQSQDGGRVEEIAIDKAVPQIALAAVGKAAKPTIPGLSAVHAIKTMNGGRFWDDITSDLPDAAAHGIAADQATGMVYIATDAGAYSTTLDLASAARAGAWTKIAGLPDAPAEDVKLDAGHNQLYVAVRGFGVYAAIAPHRARAWRVVNGADISSRAAAPGSVLSVLGARVHAARAGDTVAPVLAANDSASQIQVPFELSGNNVALSLDGATGRMAVDFPLQAVSPAIFIDADGAPMLLDGETGEMLDAARPAHSGSRVQILATGLGKVAPAWPAGVAAGDDPPKVVAPVNAFVDGAPVAVTRAVLAPGYIGFYLVEITLPQLVNAGPAELYVSSGGHESNHVRMFIEP